MLPPLAALKAKEDSFWPIRLDTFRKKENRISVSN